MHIWYAPLSRVIQNTLPATLTEKLAGHLDTATGLQYHGARYYDPWVGSYVQPDPFGGLPQAPQSFNRYGAPVVSTTRYSFRAGTPGGQAGDSAIARLTQWAVQPINAGKNVYNISLTVSGHILNKEGLGLFKLQSQRVFYQYLDEVALGAAVPRWRTMMLERPGASGCLTHHQRRGHHRYCLLPGARTGARAGV